MFIVELFHMFHSFHELRKLLELGPLVVRGSNRHIDLDRSFDEGHHDLLSLIMTPISLLVFLDDIRGSDLRLLWVLSDGAQRAPLTQEIPALIKFNFHRP